MARAVELACRADHRIRPNPAVGCVLVRGGEIVGEGWHESCGGPHAEAVALRGADARGATAYVTLEPCAHHGRTPPCADALIAAGVVRVVVGVPDPNTTATGGIARLRAAGLQVDVGVLGDRCEQATEVFLTNVRAGRAHLRLKLAATLDGRTAAADGTSQWITGPDARRRVHELRGEADAVLIGSGTALADNPSLSVRAVPTDRQPVRVVLDRRLRLPSTAALADTSGQPTVVYTTAAALAREATRADELRRAGVALVALEAPGFPASALRDLLERGCHAVLCEAGATLAGALLRADLVDRLDVVVAPKLLGGGRALLGELGVSTIDAAIRLRFDTVEQVGEDVWMSARRVR